MVRQAWTGFLKAWFTLGDDVQVHFRSDAPSPDERAIIFAAAVAIDFDVLEPNALPW